MNDIYPIITAPVDNFSQTQRAALEKEPPVDQIRTRKVDKTTLAYLEGWYVIAEANRIFGTENWDRTIISSQCVWQGKSNGSAACAYVTSLRITLRVGTTALIREASGFGEATAPDPGEAHGMAVKTAETDATKRALATLGAPFGLFLYDDNNPSAKEAIAKATRQATAGTCCATDQPHGAPAPNLGIIRDETRAMKTEVPWIAYGATGETKGVFRDPILCCSALRRIIEGERSVAALEAVYAVNKRTLARLHAERPDLRSDGNQHYSTILSALFQARLKRLSATSPSSKPCAREKSSAFAALG